MRYSWRRSLHILAPWLSSAAWLFCFSRSFSNRFQYPPTRTVGGYDAVLSFLTPILSSPTDALALEATDAPAADRDGRRSNANASARKEGILLERSDYNMSPADVEGRPQHRARRIGPHLRPARLRRSDEPDARSHERDPWSSRRRPSSSGGPPRAATRRPRLALARRRHTGDGQAELHPLMARPQSSGHLMNFSSELLMLLTQSQHAVKGCRGREGGGTGDTRCEREKRGTSRLCVRWRQGRARDNSP